MAEKRELIVLSFLVLAVFFCLIFFSNETLTGYVASEIEHGNENAADIDDANVTISAPLEVSVQNNLNLAGDFFL